MSADPAGLGSAAARFRRNLVEKCPKFSIFDDFLLCPRFLRVCPPGPAWLVALGWAEVTRDRLDGYRVNNTDWVVVVVMVDHWLDRFGEVA